MNSVQRWLIVCGGFVSYFLADGYTYSLGVFYSYFLNAFGLSGSSTAVLPGLLYAVPQLSAFFICPLLETFGYSSGAAWGAVLLSSSCVASAFAPNLHVLYFSLGVLTSIGLQLIYSSAIMAVTATFHDTKYFGLALGLMMCGSGIGSFVSNPFLAWLLNSWTWREVMVIQAAILLNSLVSAACFHHTDAAQFHHKLSHMPYVEDSVTVEGHHYGPLYKPNAIPGASSESCPTTDAVPQTLYKHNPDRSFQKRICICSIVRYILCIPAEFRFRVEPHVSEEVKPSQHHINSISTDPSSRGRQSVNDRVPNGCAEFCLALRTSLRLLSSSEMWTNGTFVTFIVANGLTGAAVVVPWTFIYDYVLVSISGPEGLDTAGVEQIAWLPSLIGLGSLCGQLIFGLITSQFGEIIPCCHRSRLETAVNSRFHLVDSVCVLVRDKRRFHLALFVLAALWNATCMLFIALLPLRDFPSKPGVSITFFDWPPGQLISVGCMFLGVSIGAIYVLYPQILLDTVGERLWASSLGICLAINGLMNLIGTTAGGRIYDATGTYRGALLMASCLPLGSALLIVLQQCFEHRQHTSVNLVRVNVS